MTTSSITVTLKGTDLVYDNSVNISPVGTVGESFDINASSVEIYTGREPEPWGTAKEAIKVNSIRIEPEWSSTTLSNPSHFMYNVYALPFILTQGLPWRDNQRGSAVQDKIVFSANTSEEWELNSFSGHAQGVPNDRWYVDPFIVHPFESLRVRLHAATTFGSAAGVWASWLADTSVANVTIEFEPYNPDDGYYARISTNDIVYKSSPTKRPEPTAAETSVGFIDLPLLDLFTSSEILNEAPFNRMTSSVPFHLNELSFRSGYPFGGMTATPTGGTGNASGTNYMYDIRVEHETAPGSDYNLRKFMSYTAGASTQLDYRSLLKDPIALSLGQRLVARIYTTGFSGGSKLDGTNQYYFRQAPAFWFNGTVPK